MGRPFSQILLFTPVPLIGRTNCGSKFCTGLMSQFLLWKSFLVTRDGHFRFNTAIAWSHRCGPLRFLGVSIMLAFYLIPQVTHSFINSSSLSQYFVSPSSPYCLPPAPIPVFSLTQFPPSLHSHAYSISPTQGESIVPLVSSMIIGFFGWNIAWLSYT